MLSLGIAPHPEGCTGPGTMPALRVTSASGAMPTDVTFRRLEIGVQAVQLSPYHAGPADASAQHLDLIVALLACDCPVHLTDPGSPLDPGTSLRVPPAC